MRSLFRNRFMARFEKTRLHVLSAVLILLGLYATAGLLHALWIRDDTSSVVWLVVALVGYAAAIAFQTYTAKKRRRTQ